MQCIIKPHRGIESLSLVVYHHQPVEREWATPGGGFVHQ